MFRKRGAMILQRLEMVPKNIKEEQFEDFFRNFEVKHPECGRVVKAVIVIRRRGKGGQKWFYARLKHADDRKAKKGRPGVAYCYEPLDEEFVGSLAA